MITNQKIAYRDQDTPLAGLFYHDQARPGSRPGLLLVHHAYGLDDHTKEHAAAYAQLGFAVFACDMYGSGLPQDREGAIRFLQELRADSARLLARASAGLQVLSGHPLVDGRLAAIGYCFGGMAVLQMARSGVSLAGAVSVHGSLATAERAAPGRVKARILVCHGGLDPHVPMGQVTQFVDEMQQAGADWQLTVYGNALHGFTHKGGGRMPGVAYHEAADARSLRAIEDFFTELFGKPDLWGR